MQPLPETRQVLSYLAAAGSGDVEDTLQSLADRIETIVPSTVGVSLAVLTEDLTLTFVSTSSRSLAIDLAQSEHGGPCLESAASGEERSAPDLLDEDRWQMYATAATEEGVRSSLSMPVETATGSVRASLNVYAADPRAFEGRVELLRAAVGALAGLVTTNADLTFASRARAVRAPQELAMRGVVDTAVGFLVAKHALRPDAARMLLLAQAQEAGVDVVDHAHTVLQEAGQGG